MRRTALRLARALQGVVLVLGIAAAAHAADESQAKKDLVLKGDAKCTRCHDSGDDYPVLSIGQTRHGVRADSRTPTCTSCHGDSQAHVDNPGGKADRPKPDRLFGKKSATPVEARNEACLSCHRSGLRTHWDGSTHQINDVACASCHVVHTPRDPMVTRALQPAACVACHREQKADIHKISAHPLAATAAGSGAKMACSDCHNPHGSQGPRLLKRNTVNETCWTCHADKRGPFLWEHQPVTEDCTNCHTPHGSNITPLLKSRAPFLCDECHNGPHNSDSPFGTAVTGIQGGGVAPGGNPSTSAVGRACLNCHSVIHGSNSPAGAFLHR